MSESDGKKQIIETGRRYKKTPFIKFMIWIAKKLMGVLWPTKVFFKERFNIEGRAIVTSNHYVKVDTNPIISTFYKHKPFKVLLKKELMEGNGFVAHFLDGIGGIPVHRGEGDIHAAREVIESLMNDEQVIIYPEGTRNKEGSKQMLPLKDGTALFAIKTKSPIVPMIHYAPASWKRKNYLLVGKPFTLEEFYNKKGPQVKTEATKILEQKYAELRKEIDEIVEVFHGNIKKYKKAHNLV